MPPLALRAMVKISKLFKLFFFKKYCDGIEIKQPTALEIRGERSISFLVNHVILCFINTP